MFAENALRSLLEALTSPPYAPMQHLEREQALAKQFAEILHFTLSFDELKVKKSLSWSSCMFEASAGRQEVPASIRDSTLIYFLQKPTLVNLLQKHIRFIKILF